MAGGLQVFVDLFLAARMQGNVAHLGALAVDPQMLHASALVDVLDHQLAELVAPQRVIEQDRDDRLVAFGLQRLGLRCLEQVPDFGAGQGGVSSS